MPRLARPADGRFRTDRTPWTGLSSGAQAGSRKTVSQSRTATGPVTVRPMRVSRLSRTSTSGPPGPLPPGPLRSGQTAAIGIPHNTGIPPDDSYR